MALTGQQGALRELPGPALRIACQFATCPQWLGRLCLRAEIKKHATCKENSAASHEEDTFLPELLRREVGSESSYRPFLFWGYYDLATGDQKYLGGVIVAKRGRPALFNITNQLANELDEDVLADGQGRTAER